MELPTQNRRGAAGAPAKMSEVERCAEKPRRKMGQGSPVDTGAHEPVLVKPPGDDVDGLHEIALPPLVPRQLSLEGLVNAGTTCAGRTLDADFLVVVVLCEDSFPARGGHMASVLVHSGVPVVVRTELERRPGRICGGRKSSPVRLLVSRHQASFGQ
jgi:hypothetical protein